MLHLFANTDITTMLRMHAHLMVSTGLIGSWEAYSSAQVPGSTVFMDAAGIGAAEAGVAADTTVAAETTDAAMVMVSAAVTAGSTATLAEDFTAAAGSEVAMAVGSTATLEEDFTAAVDPMARRLEVMVAVGVMAADTGN